ncbi:uncharacterized protein LOC143468995 isoform X3 [Clavelina lepadiformis]|uniref:uncharacterized protein LOC143468995 isoform X3 n=1 Tax=Clavelina lepadiformis TaxID=159417 RepID=UPI004041EDCA
MLSGTMYPKKTYGRSLFIGEFKHAVAGSGDKEKTATQIKPEESVTEDTSQESEIQAADPVNVAQKTLTYEVQEDDEKRSTEEVKLVWKGSASLAVSNAKSKSGPAAKAFFTPASSELRNAEAEQVLDLPVVKDEVVIETDVSAKVPKRKKLSTQTNVKLLATPRKIVPKLVNQTVLPKTTITKQEHQQSLSTRVSEVQQEKVKEVIQNREEQKKESEHGQEEISVEVETVNERPDEENFTILQADKNVSDIEPTSSAQNQGGSSKQEPFSDSLPSDDDSASKNFHKTDTEDRPDKPLALPDHKTIIIKPLDLATYAEKFDDYQEEKPANVLEPNVVADMKRDLAEKGIIVLPPSLISHASQPMKEAISDSEQFNEDIASPEQTLEKQLGNILEENGFDENIEQSSELNADKSDRKDREGFKTNKSFEIRRLQARAERMKEEKRRALFGNRYSKLKARSEHLSRTNELPVMIPLKSALKTGTLANDEFCMSSKHTMKQSSFHTKSKIGVRIREPEYDYQEYTDVELESDCNDSLRPNSGLSYSDLSSEIGESDFSEDSLSPNPGEDSYYLSSDEDNSDIHRLYDEIGDFSPSRADLLTEVTPRRDIMDLKSSELQTERIHSSTSMATARSSILLPSRERYYSQLPFMRSYMEKPMPFFDAVRHERRLQSDGRFQQSRDSMRVQPDEDIEKVQNQSFCKHLGITGDRNTQLRGWSQGSHRQNKSRHSHSRNDRRVSPEFGSRPQNYESRNKNSNLPNSIGPTVYPINISARASAECTEKEWMKTVQKFLRKSNVDHSLPYEVTAKPNSLQGTKSKRQDIKATVAFPPRYVQIHDLLDCSKKTFLSHFLWIFIPTLLCTISLLTAILYGAGVLPV